MSFNGYQLFGRFTAVGYACVTAFFYGELRVKTAELTAQMERLDERVWPDGHLIEPMSRPTCALIAVTWPITWPLAEYLAHKDYNRE